MMGRRSEWATGVQDPQGSGRQRDGSSDDPAGALIDARRRLLGSTGAFLPARVPRLNGLPDPFAPLAAVTMELAEHYHKPAAGVRRWIDSLFGEADPALEEAVLGADEATKAGLFAVLAVLAHLYRWDTVPPDPARFDETDLRLPAPIRGPLHALCDEVGVPRVGTMWSFVMCNWVIPGREGDAYDPGTLPDQDVRLACRWLRPPFDVSLENFHLAFVLLEAKGGPVIAHAVDAVAAVLRGDHLALTGALTALTEAIEGMSHQFVDRVRSTRVTLDGWLDLIQPTFGWGLRDTDGQVVAGPGGMQLGVIHVLDAVLGVPAGSTVGTATVASRRYIPNPQRQFLTLLDAVAPQVRRSVVTDGHPALKRAFNDAVRAFRRFRVSHRVQGARYLRVGRHTGTPRVSSGIVAWREDPSQPETEPAEQFERQMLDRIMETTDALAPGAGEPYELRAPDVSFRFLDRRQLRELLGMARRRSYPAGSVIIAAGERSPAMYLLTEGTALVVTEWPLGRPVATLWPGELFGELSFLGSVPTRNVVADTDVVVDVLHGDSVHTMLDADAGLAAAFYRSLAVLVAHRLNTDSSAAGWVMATGR
ncbi:MAG TPA: cyclic nucleotide-binding domain-containing protein [Egibacteraceae bacterium]|nr:cyclic nucleotide-binding domain-containing protein [Egibacteraceae bacterium]